MAQGHPCGIAEEGSRAIQRYLDEGIDNAGKKLL
jgi:hypothetical protein